MTSEPQTRHPHLTVEEFRTLPEEPGYRLELSRGTVVREPAPGLRHSEVVGRLYRRIWRAAEGADHGRVFFDAAFALSRRPATVRVPDVAFLRRERMPADALGDGPADGAPDLAVEVVSPSNRASDVQRKALEYLDAGARLVWVADPSVETVTVYRSRSDIRILGPGEILEADDVIPDLALPVQEIFGEG